MIKAASTFSFFPCSTFSFSSFLVSNNFSHFPGFALHCMGMMFGITFDGMSSQGMQIMPKKPPLENVTNIPKMIIINHLLFLLSNLIIQLSMMQSWPNISNKLLHCLFICMRKILNFEFNICRSYVFYQPLWRFHSHQSCWWSAPPRW